MLPSKNNLWHSVYAYIYVCVCVDNGTILVPKASHEISFFLKTSVPFLLPPALGYKIMSTTSAPRLIVVDDTDLSINYTGPWNYSQGSLETVGNFGSPYQNTLHIVNSNASLSYAFNGEQSLFFPPKLVNFNRSGLQDLRSLYMVPITLKTLPIQHGTALSTASVSAQPLLMIMQRIIGPFATTPVL